MTTKLSNPKDAVGVLKVSLSYVPANVLLEVAVAMHEGGCKYGRHNYRVIGVGGSVYYDAAMRHLMAWWEGEDVDPDSGLSHVTKAIASLVVMRDAQMNNNFNDDRPPKSAVVIPALNKAVADLSAKHKPAVAPFLERDRTLTWREHNELAEKEKEVLQSRDAVEQFPCNCSICKAKRDPTLHELARRGYVNDPYDVWKGR